MKQTQSSLSLAATVLALAGCSPEPPAAPETAPPVDAYAVAGEYWVEVDGTVTLSDLDGGAPSTAPGTLRVEYAVAPDGAVAIRHLTSVIDDVDLLVHFPWWATKVEALRCTRFTLEEPVAGTLDGVQMELETGVVLSGTSYDARSADGSCAGKRRLTRVKSSAPLSLTHDPENDAFSFLGSFEGGAGDKQYKVILDAAGGYLNRPPVARLTALGDDVDVGPDGCPATRPDADPPIVRRNTHAGLEVTLRSESSDPDGVWPGPSPKDLRVDLAFEQWARRAGDGFSFVGGGREVGPIVFATGPQVHELLLWVRDRHGAEARKSCRFQVIESAL